MLISIVLKTLGKPHLLVPLWSECQHDVFLVRRQFESEHPGVSHDVARDNDTAGATGGGDHDQTLVHISVHVLSVTHPSTVPGFRIKIIIQNFL